MYVCIFRPLRKETQWLYWRNNWRRGRNSWQQSKRMLLQQRTVSENSPRLDVQVSLRSIMWCQIRFTKTLSGLLLSWQPYETLILVTAENKIAGFLCYSRILSTVEARSTAWPDDGSRGKSLKQWRVTSVANMNMYRNLDCSLFSVLKVTLQES